MPSVIQVSCSAPVLRYSTTIITIAFPPTTLTSTTCNSINTTAVSTFYYPFLLFPPS